MHFSSLTKSTRLLLLLLGLMTTSVWGLGGDPKRIEAINFLGTVDCVRYPEAQKVLIEVLENDPEETARYAAAKALTKQLSRSSGPNPEYGWRPFPDPDIKQAIRTLMPGHWSEKVEETAPDRPLPKKEARRYDVCRGCCTEDVTKALAKCAYETDETGCPAEPSKRVRDAAKRALAYCCDVIDSIRSQPIDPNNPDQTPPLPDNLPIENFGATQGNRGGFEGGSTFTPLAVGRADNNNRLNLFDNNSPQPMTRVWGAYQYAQASNSALFNTSDNTAMQNAYQSDPYAFKNYTGFDTFEQFTQYNQGVGTNYLQRPDVSLYRFGFEYAFTNDFSIAMQAQYLQPLQDIGQPSLFTNPAIALKHVIYRSEKNLFTGLINISPQIPAPRFAITEDTTRIAPGFLAYHQFNEDSFSMGGFQTNIPMEHNQILTADWFLSYGHWLYQHPALLNKQEECQPWLLGVLPQFEVLGKHVLNNNSIVGMFGTNPARPQTSPDGNQDGVVSPGETGYANPIDGSRDIYIPGSNQLFSQSGFIFVEPRHVIDLTASTTLYFRGGFTWGNGVSVPVTGGAARRIEFISTLNYFF